MRVGSDQGAFEFVSVILSRAYFGIDLLSGGGMIWQFCFGHMISYITKVSSQMPL